MVSIKQRSMRIASLGAAGMLFALTLGVNVLLPAGVFAATASTVTTSPTQKAVVSFTFDDGLQSIYTKAAPALQEYGLTGTSYVISSCIGMTTVPNTCRADTAKPYMSEVQLKAVHDTFGWEIGSHTDTHPLLASTDPTDQPVALTTAQVTAELTNSKTKITQMVGVAPTAFASPYGDYASSGNPTLSEVAKLYTSHRGFADTGYNITPYNGGTLPAESVALNNYLLRDQQIQTTTNVTTVTGTIPTSTTGPANVTVPMVKAMIDKAITDKSWLVLSFHDIADQATLEVNADSYGYSTENLKLIAAYVKEKQTAGLITSSNVSAALPAPATGTTPLLNESFQNGIANNWSTDNATNVVADNGNHGNTPESTNSIAITGSAAVAHLFSPAVPVDPNQTYVISCFVNIDSLVGEIGFFIDEYDAAGVKIVQVAGTTGGGYKLSVNASTNPHVAEVSFTYKPTTTAFMAALQIIAVQNNETTYKAYVDNVKMYSVAGAPTTTPTTPTTPVTPTPTPTAPTTPTVGGKGGDVNGDNNINALDLSVLLSNWKKTGASKAQGDMNGDGIVNALDLSTLLANWGK